jgi:NAD(P)-dependent dehydrogenase (short-subunit alcohol dehydrogenase family)
VPIDPEALRRVVPEPLAVAEPMVNYEACQERARIPFGRRGVPDDIAEWIARLAGPTANLAQDV